MVCYNIQVRFTVSVPSMNRDVLIEALKLMEGVQEVTLSDFWVKDGISIRMKNGRTHIARLRDGKLEFEGQAEEIAKEVLKYYAAAVQAISLKKQNYQISVQKEGDLVRIRARK
jgi:hypothetical protein